MFNAFVHLHQFDGRSKFSTWLTRIAINAALMIVRKDRSRLKMSIDLDGGVTAGGRCLEIADSTPIHDATFAEQERSALLKKAVSRIRPSLQTAIDLRYLRDCSIEETALKLGVSVGAAKARLFHARTQLRKQITADFRIASVLQSKTTSEPRDSGYRELLFNQTASER
jgi:RNA polymerase sigma-70 factor (ECF subfamily)